MRVLMVLGWLMVPVLIGAYHYGPGQERMQLDKVADTLRQADKFAADKDWSEAVAKYDEALRNLPPGKTAESRRIRLERAKAQLMAHKLPEAYIDLKALMAELKDDASADPHFVAQARAAAASSEYYLTWLLRLEGESRDVWEPEIEAARQNYRLLTEQAESAGDGAVAKQYREDLEAAVRLARMDLSELQGLALPCQCQGCCSGNCTGRGQGKGKGNKGRSQGQGQPKDVRGGSSGPPPDNSGS